MKTGEYQKLQDKVDGLLEMNNKKQFSWVEYLGESPYCYAQDTCRSCATIAFVNMVDMRLKLAQKRQNNKKRLNASVLRSKKKGNQINSKNGNDDQNSDDDRDDKQIDRMSVQFLLDCNYYN